MTGTLYPYQKDGVQFLAPRRAAMLADEPGLGKTIQAIEAAKIAVHNADILVICPKSAISNWRNEFAKWWPGFDRLTVINFDPFSQKAPRAPVQKLLNHKWALVVIDEAHRLKSPGANRTKMIYGKLVPNADRVWLLTGTPTPNHNGELWTHLKALVPDYIRRDDGKIMRPQEFEDRYCRVTDHPDWGRRITGNRNTEELRQRIAPFVLRRRKAEVLQDLPALTFTDRVLDADASAGRRGQDVFPEGFPVHLKNDPDGLVDWLKQNHTHIASERKATGLVKVPAVVEVIEDMLDAGHDKLIVFAHHRDVLDQLRGATRGTRSVRIDGSTPQKDRGAAVDAFQTDPGVRLFFGQIQACGEALTLTAADQVLFAEFSWTPSENFQAACRAHRIGQKNAVTGHFLCLPGSLDELIAKTAARKATEIAELFS